MEFSLEDFSLKGKVALVTGGSRGIGRAIALGFAAAGADVAVAGRKLPDLEGVAGEIEALGRKALPVAAHIGRTDEIQNMVSRVKEEFGGIDILVNNAGTNPTVDSAFDYTERAWDSIMNLNLKGLFFTSQAVAHVMVERGTGGSIVNVASVAGIRPDLLPVYSISKAGVIHATRVFAKEWAKYKIRVNCIAPGLTKTRFAEFLWGTPEIHDMVVANTPMGRIAEPREMVGAVLFFASDAASYVTGQVLPIDGGVTI